MNVPTSINGKMMTQNDYYSTIKGMLKWDILDIEEVSSFKTTTYKGWRIYTNKRSVEVWGTYTTPQNLWKVFTTVEEALEYIDNLEV